MKARRAITSQSNTILVSAASAWEITAKARLGKLPGATEVAADVAACVDTQGFLPLDITLLHAQRAGRLPGEHRDPFDRMLVAQSQMEDVALVSDDDVFDGFDEIRDRIVDSAVSTDSGLKTKAEQRELEDAQLREFDAGVCRSIAGLSLSRQCQRHFRSCEHIL